MAKTPSSKKRKLSLTQKKRKVTKKQTYSQVVAAFLETLNMIKLYHWKTKSFAHHKATDELYQELSKNIDLFVEVLNGKNENRIEMLSHHLKLYDFTNKTELKIKMFEFRQLLVDLDRTFDPRDDSDLFSIRDDMLINVNQFLYLMTMDK
jgi:DNA-binding ferritin-like protein